MHDNYGRGLVLLVEAETGHILKVWRHQEHSAASAYRDNHAAVWTVNSPNIS